MNAAQNISWLSSIQNGSSENGQAEPGDFWYFEGEEVKIDQSREIDWLEEQGVCKLYEYDREVSTKVRRKGLVVERYPESRIRDLVDTHLRSQKDKRPLAAMRRGRKVYLGSDKLEAIKAITPIFQRDSKDTACFYYQSGFVSVTVDDITLSPYENLTGFIWNDWIKDRPIDLDAGNDDWLACEFGRFMRLVTAEDDARTLSLASAMGYLLHGFKDPANARAVIFTEEVVSDDPAGGTGKGLCSHALGRVVSSTDIDARRLNLESQFALQSIVPGVTRVVHFNDAGRRFQFDQLFPAITDSMTVERKGQQPIIIPFSDSPKVVITTNEVLRGRGGSHERRVFEIEFSPYFNKDRTPEDEFGHRLFDDWDAAEWNRFDRLMLYCTQLYLQHGLQPYKHVNLAWKKFCRNTSREFGDFVEAFGFEPNAPGTLAPNQQRYNKKALIDAFSKEHRQEVAPHKFTAWLLAYAELKGWELLNRLGHDRGEVAFIDHE